MSKPLLSIGIIFRDDIRSIERCLKALQPLREAIPCEVIMADTGSADGSRAVAERYADILFDFPWVNDFSAARNAVMDRASGAWFFTVDSDEYLDDDITELAGFLTGRLQKTTAAAEVIQRNYDTYEMDGYYSDFTAMRLLRMSTGMRYEGEIHESWKPIYGEFGRELGIVWLSHTILHHDGYVGLNDEQGRDKRERNVRLLRQVLERDPDDLFRLIQYVESARMEPDVMDQVRHAAALVDARAPRWKTCGPSLFRHAVSIARDRNLPELTEWVRRAEEQFPKSFCTRIDVAQMAFGDSWDKQDYADCIRRGEACLAAYAESRNDPVLLADFNKDALLLGSPSHERNLQLFTAFACQKQGDAEGALKHLDALQFQELNERQIGVLVQLLSALYAESGVDTAAMVQKTWEGITASAKDQAELKRAFFLQAGTETFTSPKGTDRPAWEVFLPLAGVCELGTAAAMLESREPGELEALLQTVDRWEYLPAAALEHALSEGVVFPLPDKPLTLEEMDILASRMAQEDSDMLIWLAVRLAECLPEDWQGLIWARELALAAVQSCDWKQTGQGMDLCRAFARIEGAVLPRYYGEALLCEENICVLPPVHRFGWYCAQAFEALDSGSHTEYARLLRAGLASSPGMKAMAEFLMGELERTMRLQAPPELLSLAEQVRTLLAAYDPDDPAVKALKASPAYQKVAHLIEGPDLGVWGGLPQ